MDSFGARTHLRVGDARDEALRLAAAGDVARLPYSLKVLLENLLRHEDGVAVDRADIEAVVAWDPAAMRTRSRNVPSPRPRSNETPAESPLVTAKSVWWSPSKSPGPVTRSIFSHPVPMATRARNLPRPLPG